LIVFRRSKVNKVSLRKNVKNVKNSTIGLLTELEPFGALLTLRYGQVQKQSRPFLMITSRLFLKGSQSMYTARKLTRFLKPK